MRHLSQLLADSAIKGRMIMPMDIRPNGRVAIEITFAEAVLYPWTMTRDQYERLVIGRNPVAHLRKRMPQVCFVELDEVFCVVWHVRPVRGSERREVGSLDAKSVTGIKPFYVQSTANDADYFGLHNG